MIPPSTNAYKKLFKTLGLHHVKPDKAFISTIVENKTQALTNKITYNISLKLTDSSGKDLGDEIASGSTSVGEEGCIFHDHAATICFHGQGTISLVVSGTNVTDNTGRYNQIGTFIVSKIVNGSGAFLGKRVGYVITEIVDDKKRNNYVYFINNASQAEVDCLKAELADLKAEMAELKKSVASQPLGSSDLASRLSAAITQYNSNFTFLRGLFVSTGAPVAALETGLGLAK